MQRVLISGSVLVAFLWVSMANAAQAHGVSDATAVSAYWGVDPEVPGCPITEPCLTWHGDVHQLRGFLLEQRGRQRPLELIRIDIREARGSKLFVAAWGLSQGEHLFEQDLRWTDFDRLHELHGDQGYRLLHLSVYGEGGRRRIAAIWRPSPREADEGLPPVRPDVVWRDLSWKQLQEKRLEMSCAKEPREDCVPHTLVAIEVYSASHSNRCPFFAGVWRRGQDATRLLSFETSMSPAPILAESLDESSSTPGCVFVDPHDTDGQPPTPEPAERLPDPLLDRLESLAGDGWRPVDFERYRLGGSERLAILLRRQDSTDWWMVPASPRAAACRHRQLDRVFPPEEVPTLSLLDLDWLDLSPLASGWRGGVLPWRGRPRLPSSPSDLTSVLSRESAAGGISETVPLLAPRPLIDTNHNGLVHDGGTSGPPDDS